MLYGPNKMVHLVLKVSGIMQAGSGGSIEMGSWVTHEHWDSRVGFSNWSTGTVGLSFSDQRL